MEKLNAVSKRLGVSKGKIKDMCKSGEITFEVVDGIYYVNIEEVKDKINLTTQSTQFFPIDSVMKFILKETLIDFKYSNVNQNHKNIKIFKKVYKNGYISDLEELEYFIGYFSNSLFDGYRNYPNEFLKWFNLKTDSDFYLLRNYYIQTNRNLSFFIEHFVMFDKLTNGEMKVYCDETVKLAEIKNFHFK